MRLMKRKGEMNKKCSLINLLLLSLLISVTVIVYVANEVIPSSHNESFDLDDFAKNYQGGGSNEIVNYKKSVDYSEDTGAENEATAPTVAEEVDTADNTKPKLILHVGVMKTGTTYIQLELLRKKRWNRIYKKLLLDNYEVITGEYEPSRFEHLIKHCLQLDEKECDYQLWQDFIDVYTRSKDWNGKSDIVQVLESFSLIPKPFNTNTKHLLGSLANTYDVRIVVFYRRLHEWILSLYSQYRKHYMFRTRDSDNPWKQDYQNVDEIKTLPDWLEDIIQSNSFHYTVPTEDAFSNIFGQEQITILDYHAGLETEFVCKGIPNATYACEEAKLIAKENKDNPEKVMRRNAGSHFLLDHDLLIIEGYRQKLITVGRHDATILLERKLHEVNMTILDFPRVCISSMRKSWLRNLAEFAENSYSSQPMVTEELKDYFDRQEYNMCSIDAAASLMDKTWRKILSSCEFQKDRC